MTVFLPSLQDICCTCKVLCSVADPWHIGVDPDPDSRIHTSDYSRKKSQNTRNQGFSYCFCFMIEGSGSGSMALTNGSGSRSRRPKNIRIRIRIRNTGLCKRILLCRTWGPPWRAVGASLRYTQRSCRIFLHQVPSLLASFKLKKLCTVYHLV